MGTDGAFAVEGLSTEYAQAIDTINKDAPACFSREGFVVSPLSDGSQRRTYATNIDKAFPECIESAGVVISEEFDRAFAGVATALETLTGAEAIQWRSNAQELDVKQFADLEKKEHIHVCEKSLKNSSSSEHSLGFHIDSGILLMVSPFPKLPLQIQAANGDEIVANVPQNSVIFVVARGLPEWLLGGTVLARMMVAPMSAVPANPKAQQREFQEVFLQRLVSSSGALDHEDSDLCPPQELTES